MTPILHHSSSAAVSPRAELVHGFDHGFHILHWRFRQNAVAQVENMTRPSVRAAQDLFNTPADVPWRRKEHGGIEIPLDRNIMSEAFPGRIEIYSPVHADDIASGSTEGCEKSARPGAEVDDWNAWSHAGNSCARMRQDESLVVFGG